MHPAAVSLFRIPFMEWCLTTHRTVWDTRLHFILVNCKENVFSFDNFRSYCKTVESFDMSVRPHRTTWLLLYGFSWNLSIFLNLSRKFKFYYDLKIITRTLHDDLGTMIRSLALILRMRNIPDKSCRKNQNTYFKFKFFSWKSPRLWDIVGKYGAIRQTTDGNIITRMRFSSCVIKATDRLFEYVILIALPRQH
jgi:hypothetical protein